LTRESTPDSGDQQRTGAIDRQRIVDELGIAVARRRFTFRDADVVGIDELRAAREAKVVRDVDNDEGEDTSR
jgi:hypothetical protein